MLYLDLGMGAAGDMLAAALLELTGDVAGSIAELNAMNIPGVRYEAAPSKKCGITGTHLHVYVDGQEESTDLHEHTHEHAQEHHGHEHHGHDHTHEHAHEHEHEHHHHHTHRSLTEIEEIINTQIQAPEDVKERIREVYRLIAEAESHVHGTTVSEIHFHEVGTMDAIADVAAVSYLMKKINPGKVCASPVHVGSGTVHCAHGILPVPAPATAHILQGIPMYSKEEIQGELCTPTGAALLKTFVNEFKNMPVMTAEKIGYGMGSKDFPVANCVRAFLAEEAAATESIFELLFTVDDMTGEEIAYATEVLLQAGARDVFTTSVQMKKNRPGTLVTVLTTQEKKEALLQLIFKHTSTLGVRVNENQRYTLGRKITEVNTNFGTMHKKEVQGFGVQRFKYEYEDLKRMAEERNCGLREIKEQLREEER